MTTDAQATGSPAMRRGRGVVARLVAGLAGSAVLGVLAGLLWGMVAPRATLKQVGAGEATIISAETHAFIAADAWFCAIAAVAGLLTGVLGYRFLVTRRDTADRGAGGPGHGGRALVTTGLILGAVAGSLLMMWVGGLIGLSGYLHTLATARAGTLYPSSLSLGAKSALAFWPLLTSVVIFIAEWNAHREAIPPPMVAGPDAAQ